MLSEWILAALLQEDGLLEYNNGTQIVMLNVQVVMETASPLMSMTW
jgi:hypothetical protein